MPSLRRCAWITALAVCAVAQAQSEEDALRFSWTLPGGTARSWAMGGAFGAIGADPASASTNPAGFGLYNASELSLTPVFEVNDSRATYYGNATSSAQQRLALQNMALMLNYPSEGGKKWRGGTFGISFDRQSSFHWKERAMADRVPGSIIQRFVNEAQGTSYQQLESGALPFSSGLAWYAYAMDTIPGDSASYIGAIPTGTNTKQDQLVDASGRLNTTSFFYANNFNDKVYFGITLGLVGVRFERYTTHKETTADPAIDLETLRYKEDLVTTGNGVDVKVGMIARATDKLRLGASFHSPMWLLLSDAYGYSLLTNFRAGDGYVEDSPTGSFSYRVNTPWRVLASAAYQVGKSGIISVDYTYTDYRNARLRASRELVDEYDFALENELIRDRFRGTHGVRAGTEWRSGAWYIRGGWAYVPSGYGNNDKRQGSAYRIFTGGLGFRQTHFNIDLAVMYGKRTTQWYTYSPELVDPVSSRLGDVRTMLTLSLRP